MAKNIDSKEIITLLRDDNPKRGKSRVRFQFYFDLMKKGVPFTVGDYVDMCVQAGTPKGKALDDIRWDTAPSRNFIRLEGYEPMSLNQVTHINPVSKGPRSLAENQEESSPLKEEMARSWFGYGHWEAQYWFVGPEQGGCSNDSNHCRDAEAWDGMGRGELLDCRDHHEKMGNDLWHGERASIQFTWGDMIRILLAFNGEDVTDEKVLSFQKDHWGRSEDETAVIELFGGRAKNMKEKNPYRTAAFKKPRIKKIREQFSEHRPKWVIFYGISWKKDYQKIFGAPMDNLVTDEKESFRFSGKNRKPFATWGRSSDEKTIGICVYHPSQQGTNPPDSDWILLGKILKEMDQR